MVRDYGIENIGRTGHAPPIVKLSASRMYLARHAPTVGDIMLGYHSAASAAIHLYSDH